MELIKHRKKGQVESNWTLAHSKDDIEHIIDMAEYNFQKEVEGILTVDSNVFRKHLTVATTIQSFDRSKEFIAICRTDAWEKTTVQEFCLGVPMAYCWFDRGGYTTYSNEEISNAKFHHVDLQLPARLRVRLINEMIDQHILWAHRWGIPVVCSTSIRAEHDGFMKIHKKRGFTVNGSYAWIRTEKGMECLTK